MKPLHDHHTHKAKKLLAIAGLGIAVAALAVGMIWHMKKEED